MPEKCISEAFLFCVGSLLQCFRDRIRAQIFRSDLVTVRPPPIHLLVAHLLNNTSLLTSYVSFSIAKAFWTLSEKNSFILKTNHWYRIQTLMLFSQLQFYPTFSLSCVWNSLYFLLCFANCEHAATTQRAPIFVLSVSLLLLHFTLFACTLLRMSFEVLFLNLCLGTLYYKKIKKVFLENHIKIWEIVTLIGRRIIKQTVSKKCNKYSIVSFYLSYTARIW